MLHVKQIQYTYAQSLALNNISFETPKTGLIGLLGENGAGKSTLIKILCGILEADQGEIFLDGEKIQVEGEARKHIGYLSEKNPMYEEMNVLEYLLWIQSIKGGSVEEVIDELQLDHVKKQKIKTLSKGFKQRVGIAQAIMNHPKLLILDEPMVGLDPTQIIVFREFILKLKSKLLIMMSTHQLNELMGLADDILLMHQGKILRYAQVEQLAKEINQNMVRIELDHQNPQKIENFMTQKSFKYHLNTLNDQNRLVLSIDATQGQITEILRDLISIDCQIYDVQYHRTSLDDIFRYFKN